MKILPALLIAIACQLCVPAARAQSSNSLIAANLKWSVTHTGELHYLVQLPADYSAKSGKRWPLMLFLHGAGERGTNLDVVASHGPLKLAKQGTNFPFIIVAPQCPRNEVWKNEPLLKLLESMETIYAVDESRVYLTGLSMGGFGTWSLGVAHPEKFAAIAPICGGGNFIEPRLASRPELKTLGVWAFHGVKDPVVPVAESERIVETLKKIGCKDVRLTLYPEAGHDAWTETYANPKFYEWLLSHAR